MGKSDSRRAQEAAARVAAKLKIGVFGASGRMGTEVLQLWQKTHGKSVFFFTDRDLVEEKASQVEVWVDFSSPEGLEKILSFCVQHRQALVSGTTGLSPKAFKALDKASRKIPILWAPNMSLGVNILAQALQSLKSAQNFDFQIEEVHHRHKKDKPSGTALRLQEELQLVIGRRVPDPLALRGGGVFGIHKVWAMSDEEVLIFEHQALNRAVFAKGALSAALWLAKKRPGRYSIQNMLGGSK